MARGSEKIENENDLASQNRKTTQDARNVIRSTQRLASQLHQLIAVSITVAALRSEDDILKSLTDSARRVFDADLAVLSLESGSMAPLRGVARRGKRAICVGPDDFETMEDIPALRASTSAPWRNGDWLVAPVLERRNVARGVLAVRRSSGEFLVEDKEVLTLLAQMAATALSATELSRGVESSETRLRILVETAPAGIVEVDLGGTIQWWNRAASKIFGWSEFDEGGELDPRFPDAALPELVKLWSDVRSDTTSNSQDFIEIEIRGRRRDLSASAALLPSPDGEARSILMLVDDVTTHRQLKAEVQHAQQMETRGRVASSVAHDFNNLLTLISGYAEILSKDLAADPRSLSMVKDIQATASRASLLTAQLQTIGRTESLEPVVLNPATVLQSSAEVLERIVGVDIELTWSIDPNAGSIRVDAGQFEQMMLNLAINARDAMTLGGQLQVAIDNVAIDRGHADDLNIDEGDFVVIRVSDTGVGMDDETRLHCFDPFFTTKGPFKGTGLGLAAARRLVEESGGAITCHSEVGVGTTFEILFPKNDDVVAVEAPSPVVERPRGSATVLLAEDDEGLRRLMVQVLGRNGYRVLVAESAERALEVRDDFDGNIDLLVSDVVMAELSGPDLAAALQKANPALRVLLTSGTADSTIINELLPGTAAFLPKPFRPSALIDQVHELLSRR
jgi:two-component system cell cycle sensor histidine kinase/response regulator CckA